MRRLSLTVALFSFLSFLVPVCSYSITGVHAGVNNVTGARPFRQNINVFKQSGPAWDLYILSLSKFMSIDQDEKFSYYRISGIHGYPANTPWDSAIGTGGGIGYCEHGSVLFPVWHRPYLALFEEKVWQLAQDIATQYPLSQRAEYTAAAISLRIPYWDWSLEPGLPDVTMSPQISINSPTGKRTMNNPLYAYKFNPLRPDELPDLSQYNTSVREPNALTLQSQDDLVTEDLQNNAAYWHDNTYLLFSSISDWSNFSTNLESIHGGIHVEVGGPSEPNRGHMTFLWYSSFDPIFWLHHAQVDRLVAIWQAIHPYSYIEPQASTMDTYYTPAGTLQTQTYPLAPFRLNSTQEFHTGQTVRRLKTFGYSYPELVYWSKTGSNVWTLRKEVIAMVNKLYLPDNTDDQGTLEKSLTNSNNLGSSLRAKWEWRFNVILDQTSIIDAPIALSFTYDNGTRIGPQVLLRNEAGFFTSNTAKMPLTQTLLHVLGKDIEPKVAIPWIKDNIKATAKAAINIDVILVLVARNITQPPNNSAFPEYGSWTEHVRAVLTGNSKGSIDWK